MPITHTQAIIFIADELMKQIHIKREYIVCSLDKYIRYRKCKTSNQTRKEHEQVKVTKKYLTTMELEYWRKLRQILTSEKLSFLKYVEDTLNQYYQTLKNRNLKMIKTDNLRKENEELREALGKHLASDINTSLYSPSQIQIINQKQ